LQKEENAYLCNGQSSCRAVFPISPSTAAWHQSAGGLIFAGTGSQGNGAERKVPAIKRIVKLSCTSTKSESAERVQTGQQYSSTRNVSIAPCWFYFALLY